MLSTTLSDPQGDLLQLEHALQVVRSGDEEVGGEDLLDDGAHARQREVA